MQHELLQINLTLDEAEPELLYLSDKISKQWIKNHI